MTVLTIHTTRIDGTSLPSVPVLIEQINNSGAVERFPAAAVPGLQVPTSQVVTTDLQGLGSIDLPDSPSGYAYRASFDVAIPDTSPPMRATYVKAFVWPNPNDAAVVRLDEQPGLGLDVGGSGSVDRGEVLGLINEQVREYAIINNDDKPRARELADHPVDDYALRAGSDGFCYWGEADNHYNQIGTTSTVTSSGTTWIATTLRVPTNGFIWLDFENGRMIQLDARWLHALTAGTDGQEPAAGQFISLQDVIGLKGFYIGLNSTSHLLLSDRTGGGTPAARRTSLRLYVVTSSPQAPSQGFDQVSTDARIRALVNPVALLTNVARWVASKLPEYLQLSALKALIASEIPTHDDIVTAKEDLGALRYQTTLGSATTPSGGFSNTPHDTQIDVPAFEAAGRLRVSVGELELTIELSDFHAKPAISLGTPFTDSNSFVLNDPVNVKKYYFVQGNNGHIFAGSDETDGFTAQFVLSRIDLEDFARRSSTAQVPASKLQNVPNALDQAAVDARIDAKTADWAEQDNTDPIPADKLTNAPAGGGGGLDQAAVDGRVQALVNPIALVGNVARWIDSKLPERLSVANLTTFIRNFIAVAARAGDKTRWAADKTTPNLEALDSDFITGGWADHDDLLIARLADSEYTLATARTAEYVARETAFDQEVTDQYTVIRIPDTLFNGEPTTDDLKRLRLVDGLTPTNEAPVWVSNGADGTVLGRDAAGTFTYLSLQIDVGGVGDRVEAQFKADTKLDIHIDADNIDGNLPASQVSGLPSAGLVRLHSGSIAPPTLINSNLGVDSFSNRVALGSLSRLNVGTDTHGTVELIATLTINAGTPSNLSFSSSEIASTAQVTVFTSASTLAALAEYTSGQTGEEVILNLAKVYSGAGEIGQFQIRLSRDSSNNISARTAFDSTDSTSGRNLTMSINLVAFFQKSDVPEQAGGGGGFTEYSAVLPLTLATTWTSLGVNIGSGLRHILVRRKITATRTNILNLYSGVPQFASVGGGASQGTGIQFAVAQSSSQTMQIFLGVTSSGDIVAALAHLQGTPNESARTLVLYVGPQIDA